jgi:hypothetical protein
MAARTGICSAVAETRSASSLRSVIVQVAESPALKEALTHLRDGSLGNEARQHLTRTGESKAPMGL